MSEFTDLVTDVERLIRQKTVLLADVERATEQAKVVRQQLERLEQNVESINSAIESKKRESLRDIEAYNKNQGNVIAVELKRLEDAYKSHDAQQREQSETDARQRQRENELRGLEALLLEREKNVILSEAKQKTIDAEISAKNDDILQKMAKLKNYIEQLKITLQENEQSKNEIVKANESINKRQVELKDLEREISLKMIDCERIEKKNSEELKKLEEKSTLIDKKLSENNEFRALLDKRKKDIDDKERSLDAEKTEMALSIAKARIKNK